MKTHRLTTTTGRLTALTVAIALAASCAQQGGRPEVAAVVEGIEVTSDETESLVKAYLTRPIAEPRRQALSDDDVTRVVLEHQIKLALLEHAAEDMGVGDQPEPDLDAAAELLDPEAYALIGQRPEDFVEELRAGRLSRVLAEKLFPVVSPPESVLRQEYERLAPLLDRHWKATVEVARFRSQAPVQALGDRVRQGEAFEQVASTLGAEGVGTVEINPLVAPLGPAVLDVVGGLAAGEVSDPIPVGDEHLAIRVKDRQDLPKMSFEDLRPELTGMLAERERFQRFHRWFKERLAKAEISVHSYYGEWDRELTAVS